MLGCSREHRPLALVRHVEWRGTTRGCHLAFPTRFGFFPQFPIGPECRSENQTPLEFVSKKLLSDVSSDCLMRSDEFSDAGFYPMWFHILPTSLPSLQTINLTSLRCNATTTKLKQRKHKQSTNDSASSTTITAQQSVSLRCCCGTIAVPLRFHCGAVAVPFCSRCAAVALLLR